MRRFLCLAGFCVALTSMVSPPAMAQSTTAAQAGAKQKMSFSRDAIQEMQDGMKSVTKLLDAAERDGDVDRIQCVRNKSASVRALLEVSQRADNSMKDAIASGETQRAEHEFRKVAVAISKVRQFVAEAEACMGDTGAAVGTTEIEVTSEGIAKTDDTAPLVDDDLVVGVDPPPTSPFE